MKKMFWVAMAAFAITVMPGCAETGINPDSQQTDSEKEASTQRKISHIERKAL